MKRFTKFRLLIILFLVVALPFLVIAGQKIQQYLSEATGTPANLVIDVQQTLEPIAIKWDTFSQGGEESKDMIAPIVNEVKQLNPRYIRIDHLYDHFNVVSRGGDGQLTFNFSELDQIVGSIRKTGALPFLSLSYMPQALTSGNITDKPNNWSEWSLVVRRTVEHYSGKSGWNLSDVYYEVWNEPDLFGGWKYYGDKNYLTLYSYAVSGAQTAQNVNSFKIGGPATTQLYPNWITAIAKYAAQQNIRLDFISWHRYNYDPTQFARDVEVVTKALFDYPQFVAIPRVISEWGYNPEVHAGYDGNFAAAHAVATIRQSLSGYEMLMGFELVDGKSQENKEYWGRWGLMTHPDFGKKLKPRYFAFLLLQKLTGTRLNMTGEGTWVTGVATKTDNGFQLLLSNYDQFGSHSETVPIEFRNMTDEQYILKTTRLAQAPATQTVTVANSQFTTQFFMPANSIALLELTPQ